MSDLSLVTAVSAQCSQLRHSITLPTRRDTADRTNASAHSLTSNYKSRCRRRSPPTSHSPASTPRLTSPTEHRYRRTGMGIWSALTLRRVDTLDFSERYGWWRDMAHPPYDGNLTEMDRWAQWAEYGLQPPSPPPPPPPRTAKSVAWQCCTWLPSLLTGPVVQWRYVQRSAMLGKPPSIALTAVCYLPAVLVGAMLVRELRLPFVHYQSIANARQWRRPWYWAGMSDEQKRSFVSYALWVHYGFVPWPLPLRTASTTGQDDVPAWVDKPPSDVESTWSESRMEWQRRMAEEWGYTAEDVAVRDKVQSSAFWCNVLPYTHCLTAVVGGLGSVRRRSMRLAEAATACFSPRVQRSCLHSRCPIYAVVGFSVVRSEGASLVQRPARGPTRPRQQRLQTRVLRAPLLSPDEPSLALQRLVLLLPVPYNTWCTSMRYAIDSLAELVIRRAWAAERLTPLCCAQQNRCSCDLSCIPQRSRTTSSHHSLLCLSSLRLHCQAVAVPWETACSIRRLIVLTVVVSLTVRRVAPHESVEREDGGE